MKTLILMLCVAIGFVMISDPRQERSTASVQPVDQLAKVLDKLSGNDAAMLELISNQGAELEEATENLRSQLVSLKESLDDVKTEAPKAEVDGCDCNCNETLKAMAARLEALEAFKSNYPSVSSTTSGGSTGSVKSGGSTGSVSYGSTGSAVKQGENLQSVRTPLRTTVSAVTAPLRREMTLEEKMDLHDAMHEGDGIDHPGHWTFPGDIDSHLQGHLDNRVQPNSVAYPPSQPFAQDSQANYSPQSRVPVPTSKRGCPPGGCPQRSQRTGWYPGKNLGL